MSDLFILNVDDHEPGRYARTRLLQQAGYSVHEAASGTEALELVGSLRPSLVILDVKLPGMNGLEVCHRIKSDGKMSQTAVLQVSASAISSLERVEGLDNGADSYLIEPIDPSVLLATVRALLRMRRAELELQRSNAALKQVNAELEKVNCSLTSSNQGLQHFAYLASHDLQEPLRTVSSFAALLERRCQTSLDQESREFLEHIQNGAQRMHLLINDLLLYAQVGQDQEAPTATVNMEDIFRWASKDLEKAISESAAEVTHDALPEVKGDEVQLTQLLQNLIGNALKYKQPGKTPQIHASSQTGTDGLVQFSIKDNGLGVAPAHQAQIFAPFKRLHGREIPGTGIGLATCTRIVERHGGRIWIESEGAGRGSTFFFTLPAAL